AYCAQRGVPHRRIGKVVVATEQSEIGALESYVAKAQANGVSDLRWLSQAELRELEPALLAVGGFHSPSTGIVDSHALMLGLQGEVESRGASVVFLSPVISGEVGDKEIVLAVGGAEPMTLACDCVVNSAGLFAQNVARSLRGLTPGSIPPQYFAKTHYYTLSG